MRTFALVLTIILATATLPAHADSVVTYFDGTMDTEFNQFNLFFVFAGIAVALMVLANILMYFEFAVVSTIFAIFATLVTLVASFVAITFTTFTIFALIAAGAVISEYKRTKTEYYPTSSSAFYICMGIAAITIYL
ncbi:hypothetical protein CL630_02530 [bacterium]|nr:hypothetical protein [bacterium]|tara:strand:+ start:30449 stop:30856 length:408 start_codon:yes stop_codon:yes gene_type:complete